MNDNKQVPLGINKMGIANTWSSFNKHTHEYNDWCLSCIGHGYLPIEIEDNGVIYSVNERVYNDIITLLIWQNNEWACELDNQRDPRYVVSSLTKSPQPQQKETIIKTPEEMYEEYEKLEPPKLSELPLSKGEVLDLMHDYHAQFNQQKEQFSREDMVDFANWTENNWYLHSIYRIWHSYDDSDNRALTTDQLLTEYLNSKTPLI